MVEMQARKPAVFENIRGGEVNLDGQKQEESEKDKAEGRHVTMTYLCNYKVKFFVLCTTQRTRFQTTIRPNHLYL